MKFKALLLAAIFAIAVVGVLTPELQAQDAVNPFGWFGVSQKFKNVDPPVGDGDMDFSQDLWLASLIGIVGAKNGVNFFFFFGVNTVQPTYFAKTPKGYVNYTTSNGINIEARWWTPVHTHLCPIVPIWKYNGWDNDAASLKFSKTIGEQMTVYLNLLQPGGGTGVDGELQVAVIADSPFYIYPTKPLGLPAGYGKDILFPKIGAGFQYKMDTVTIDLDGVYQTYTFELAGDPIDGKSLAGYAALLNAAIKVGTINIKAGGSYGANMANLGFWFNPTSSSASWDGSAFVDVTTISGYATVDTKFGDIAVAGGGGYQMSSSDSFAADDTAMSVAGQIAYSFSPSFTVQLTADYFDKMKDSADADEAKEITVSVDWKAML